MNGPKEAAILSTSISKSLFKGSSAANEEDFRKIVGALHYLCLTCPNISYAVNKFSQFMHNLTQTHYTTLKRVLKYLKETLFHGLFIKKAASLQLIIFSDSGWVENVDDKTSINFNLPYMSWRNSSFMEL